MSGPEYTYMKTRSLVRSYDTEEFGNFIHRAIVDEVPNDHSNFEICILSDPNYLFKKLKHLLVANQQSETRLLVSRIFHDHLAMNVATWNRLTQATKAFILRGLLDYVVEEQPDDDLTQSLLVSAAMLASTTTGWLIVAPVITQFVKSDELLRQEIGYRVFTLLQRPPYDDDILDSLRGLMDSFSLCLRDHGDIRVQTAAVTALIRYLPHLVALDGFANQIPYIMYFVMNAVADGYEGIAQRTLTLFTTLAQTYPLCFIRNDVMEEVVGISIRVGKSPFPQFQTRSSSLFLTTSIIGAAIQRSPINMVPDLLPHIERLLEVSLEMMEDLPGEPDWHFNRISYGPPQTVSLIDNPFWGYTDETTTFRVGKFTLLSLCLALDPEALTANQFEHLENYTLHCLHTYTRSVEWRKRHAAVLTLALLADRFLSGSFEKTRDIMLHGFADAEARVRWATISYSMKLFSLFDNLRPVLRRDCSIWLLKLAHDSNVKVEDRAHQACDQFGLEVELEDDILCVSLAGMTFQS